MLARIPAPGKTLNLMIAVLVVLGMLGLGPASSARAATKNLGCPNYSSLANAIGGASSGDVLTLACSAPTTIPFTGTITVRTNVTLDASASPAPITLDGQGSVRQFVVAQGAAFALNSLTVYRGWVVNSSAGGGGAVYNLGTLSVTNSTFRQSSAGYGGAIDDAPNSSLAITKSAFLSDSAAVSGGAIFGSGVITITNSTFSGNSAPNGGAIFALNPGSLTIGNSTFARNSTASGRGAVQGDDGMDSAVWASIFASNSGGNCRLPSRTQDKGYNLTDTNGNCGLTSSTDLVNTDPQLSPPADNGGPTPTMALAPSSPAIGQVPRPLCPATDQRGVARPAPPKTACDIGAYEYAFPPVTPFDAVQKCKDGGLWPTTSPPPLPLPTPTPTASVTFGGQEVIAGWVFLDDSTPVRGATVRLASPSGQSLSPARDTTNENGVFILRTGRLPAGFRVVASGGTAGGRRFTGTLTTRVTGYLHLAPLYLDPATTLVDRYVALHPGATIGQATARVKQLLGVPAWVSLGPDLEVSDRYFNGDVFLQHAAQQGGVGPLMDRLEAVTDSGQLRAFRSTARFRKRLINPAADWILSKVAGGAVSYAGGKAFAWVLGQMGVKSDTQQILDQISVVQSQLLDVQRSLLDVKAALEELKVKTDRIYVKQIVDSLDNQRLQVDDAEAGINLVADAASKPAVERENLACGVLYYYVEPVATPQPRGTPTLDRAINQKYTSASPSQLKLMQAYIDAFKSGDGRWFTAQTDAEILQSLAYWETYQALTAQIRMEWEHANGCPGSPGCTYITQLVPTIQGYATTEEGLLPKLLPNHTFIDSRTNTMWAFPKDVQPTHDSVTIGSRTYTWDTGREGLQNAYGALQNEDFVNATSAQPAGSASHRDLFGGYSDWRVARLSDWQNLTSDFTGDRRRLIDITRIPPPGGPGLDINTDFQFPITTNDGANWLLIEVNRPPLSVLSGGALFYGVYAFARSDPNLAPYWTERGKASETEPRSAPVALPYVAKQLGGGLTAGFDVYFESTNPGDGRVYFGPGPGCDGLTGTASEDDKSGGTDHLVHVTGDEANLSAGAILPGQTYSFEVVTVTKQGVETDENGGQCYTVTIPTS